MRQTTWSRVKAETSIVMARKVQHTRKLPRYPEKTVRLSGSPRTLALIQIGKVRPSAMNQTVAAARNLPRIAAHGESGKVPRSSIVPVRCSSDHIRIPTAGARSM